MSTATAIDESRTRAPLLEALTQEGADVSKPNSIRCPWHKDQRPSGGTYEKDGVWRYKCQSCGWIGNVYDLRAKQNGTTPKEEFAQSQEPSRNNGHSGDRSKGRIVATYSYVDEHGVLLMEVVRFDPKDFRQRRPDGNGWIWSVKGVRRVLYRLRDILALDSDELAQDAFIYVCEGEKDADRLASEGMTATSTLGGAMKMGQRPKWTPQELEPLHGKHVVLLPDNDPTGWAHARGIAHELHGKAASVRIVQLEVPDKGDVSDWLDAGHDPEELWQLAENTELWTPGDDPQNDTEEPPKRRAFIMRQGDSITDAGTKYLWRRRVPIGAITVIFSRPGRGKSTQGATFTSRVTNGQPWPDGAPCPRGTVLYIKGEGTDAAIRDRMMAAGADGSRYFVIGRADDDDAPMIDLAADGSLLTDALDQLPDTKLVIVDTLDSLFPSMKMIDNAHIRRCLWPLQEIAEQRQLAVVIYAHTNKGGYADPLDRLSGGRAIGGAARAIWYLGKLDPEADECYFAPVKCNDFAPASTLEYRIVSDSPDRPGSIHWGDECETTAWELDKPKQPEAKGAKADECEQWLRELLTDAPRPTGDVSRFAEKSGFGDYVLKKAKRALETFTKPAKGTFPPVHYVCLPGQSPPDMTPSEQDEPAQSEAVPM